MSIVFATRTGLAIHHGTVEVLHLIGAHDTFIATQFQWHALAPRPARRRHRAGARRADALVLGEAAGGAMPAGGVGALPSLTLTPADWGILLLLRSPPPDRAIDGPHHVLRALARMP